MLLWKNKGKSDQPFSVLISAKPQWLTLMFFGKRSFGSSVCGHVHLISAKWESPDRNHDLFWVGTSQNLFAKETLYTVLTCAVRWGETRGRLTWGWKTPASGQVEPPQKGVLNWGSPGRFVQDNLSRPQPLLCIFVFWILHDLNFVFFFFLSRCQQSVYGHEWKLQWKSLSCVRLFTNPWTIPTMEFSRPEYWSG